MKKILSYLTIFLLSMMFFTSCEETDIRYSGPEIASFASDNSVDYFVKETGDTGVEITAGFTTTSSSPRTINFTLGGDAVEGQHYSLSANSITVPAGEYTGAITVNGLFAGFSGEVATLTLTLQGEGVENLNDTYTVSLQQFCPLAIDGFTGYFVCEEAGYGAYLVAISQDPDTENGIIIENFWDWSGVLRVTFSGDEAQTLTVPEQTVVMGNGNGYVTTGSGTYNGCSNSMTLVTNVGGNPTNQIYYPYVVKSDALITSGKRGN
jgi:hypothetical protein